jgi:hypothetical protein
MLFFKVDDQHNVTAIEQSMPESLKTSTGYKYWSRQIDGTRHAGWLDRNDIGTMEYAEQIAESATKLTGELYIATDAGDHVAPRFDVIAAPKVGDRVSATFNGDYYDEGRIARVSPSLKVVTTSTGRKFYRLQETGAWLSGYFALIPGAHNRLNPEF